MESKGKTNSMGGFEELETNGEVMKVACNNNNNNNNNKRSRMQGMTTTCEIVVRVLALALSLSGAVILGVDKEAKLVPVKVVDNLPPLSVLVSAKWHYLSAFMFFVVANALACSYAAVSTLVLLLANRGGGKSISGLTITILDVVMSGLLFSANGAAAAIGLMGYEGNSHVQWKKVCNVFDRFCHQGAAALIISVFGAVAFLLLVVLSVKRLQKNY